MKSCLLILTLSLTLGSLGKGVDSLSLYVNTSVNYNFNLTNWGRSDFTSFIYNYSDKLLGYDVLHENSLKADIRKRPIQFCLPIDIQLGIKRKIDIHSNINLEFGYTNIIKTSDDYARLRFSDMVSSQGYTSASRFATEKNFFNFNILNISFGYEREIAPSQFVSIRLGAVKLLSSSYFLNIVDVSNDQRYDYANKDVSFKDGFIAPFGSVRYSYDLREHKIRARLFGELSIISYAMNKVIDSGNLKMGLQFTLL